MICNSAITACEKGAQAQRAFLFLQQISCFQLGCCIVSCNAAITLFEKSQRWDAALGLMQEIIRKLQMLDSVKNLSGSRASHHF